MTASSYIKTEATSVTRPSDTSTLTGSNFSSWYRSDEMTIIVAFELSSVSGINPIIQLDDATANEIIAIRVNSTNPELYVVDDGVDQAQMDAGTVVANTECRLAARIKANDLAVSLNGAAVVTDTAATLPTVTQMRLGSNGTDYLGGHIKSLTVYPKALTDAQLQALTQG